MSELKTKEKSEGKVKRKLMLISGILTIIFIVIAVIGVVLFGEDNSKNNYITPNSYSFLGNVLTTVDVYKDISLAIEEKDNSIYAVTLRNHELVNNKVICSNIDYSDINDFSVVLGEYNLDNNKDFSYISGKNDTGYIYKFYTIDKVGNINELAIDNITLDTKKASVRLIKNGDKYEYNAPIFYYDGYKVSAEVGAHKLDEKTTVKKTISRTSKISIDGRYKAIPRKYKIVDEIPESLSNANSYLNEVSAQQCIEVDLEGDGLTEYIVKFVREGKTYINLFDNSYNFVINLVIRDGDKKLNEVIEIVDVDNDGVMEVIVIKDSSLEVHKYNRGFYY